MTATMWWQAMFCRQCRKWGAAVAIMRGCQAGAVLGGMHGNYWQALTCSTHMHGVVLAVSRTAAAHKTVCSRCVGAALPAACQA
jgi:hypothetical protein